jgi:Flp pilus assembly protein CpaB
VSRRARAIAFAALAIACAGLAAAVASGYRGGIEAQLGALRGVVVATGELDARREITARDAAEVLELRRVPSRFAPGDSLTDPRQAIGSEPLAPIPAGAYLTATLLRVPVQRDRRSAAHPLAGDRQAVEITIAGAEALTAAGSDPTGQMVDVVVTTEPQAGGGPGRTYVAADGVRLIALREADGPGAPEVGPMGPSSWVATLAATRSQALRLIQAHNYARELRLIGAGR